MSKEIIDRKFIFKAVNPCNEKEYTEENALILCAKDKAVIPALEAYMKACSDMECDIAHVGSIALLIDRVREYQANVETRIPDTVGECEISRCIDGEVLQVSEEPHTAIDHFLHEMRETLKAEIAHAHRFLSLGAYASADKAGTRAEVLEHIISRYQVLPL